METMCRRLSIALLLASGVFAALPQVPGATAARGLIAPASACPHQGQLTAPSGAQEEAMACMTNYARTRAGLEPLRMDADLFRSADHKGADIVRCDSFSHTACGRDFTYWIEQVGYPEGNCWRAGENIAWGTGGLGTVRSTFRSWMGSPGHRANILGSDYDDLGVGLRVGTLDGYRAAHVWIQHFAKRC